MAAVSGIPGEDSDLWGLWDFNAVSDNKVSPIGLNLSFSATGQFASVQSACAPHVSCETTVIRSANKTRVASMAGWNQARWAHHGDVLLLATKRGVALWRASGPLRFFPSAAANPRDAENSNIGRQETWGWADDDSAIGSSARVIGVRSGRVANLQGAIDARYSAFSPNGTMYALWNLAGNGPSWALSASLVLQVFDVRLGCLLLQVDEQEARVSRRQSIVGPASPRWIPNSDILELPVLGGESFGRLLLPRLGSAAWVTVTEENHQEVTLALAADGRFTGTAASVDAVLARPGAPIVQGPLRREPALLDEFLARVGEQQRRGSCRKVERHGS